MQWTRSIPFLPDTEATEIWTYQNASTTCSFNVNVSFGKRLDTFRLKKKEIKHFGENVRRIRTHNEALFAAASLKRVTRCPVCKKKTNDTKPEATFYGGTYHQCLRCDHRFVIARPHPEVLKAFYKEDKSYQAAYADRRLIRIRLETVAIPKLDWVLRQFQNIYGTKPTSLLDVGAGSGHFVKAAKDAGLTTEGIELSDSGVQFAKQNFNIRLKQIDFVKEKELAPSYEIITFWGVIEHVADPMQLLETAVRKLDKKRGMIVAEVPRWHSLSTAIQKLFPKKIIRHLVPSTHIQFFSNASLATAFLLSGLRPRAAWYFGMDSYELAVQLLSEEEKGKRIEGSLKYINCLQPLFDQHRFCDFLVLAGIP